MLIEFIHYISNSCQFINFFEKGSWRGGRVGRRRGGGMEGGGVLKGITILQVTLKFDKAVFV